MNRIGETPDENQRWRHDDLLRMINTVIKGHLFTHRYRDDPANGRVPVDACDRFVFAELQVCEGLILLKPKICII